MLQQLALIHDVLIQRIDLQKVCDEFLEAHSMEHHSFSILDRQRIILDLFELFLQQFQLVLFETFRILFHVPKAKVWRNFVENLSAHFFVQPTRSLVVDFTPLESEQQVVVSVDASLSVLH